MGAGNGRGQNRDFKNFSKKRLFQQFRVGKRNFFTTFASLPLEKSFRRSFHQMSRAMVYDLLLRYLASYRTVELELQPPAPGI